MRILFLGNNWVGWQIASWLKQQHETIVGLVLHPQGKRKFGDELLYATDLAPTCVFDGSRLHEPQTLNAIRDLRADIGISALFGHIVKKPFLELLPAGCVNIHSSLLPYNRGAHPNIWSIVEGTPAGATIHYIDEGVDTGDIIAQKEIAVEALDTGKTLYQKLEIACVELFRQTWPRIRAGKVERIGQPRQAGTFHRVSDVQKIDEIDLDRMYTARELINLLRARTFAPYPSAYFRSGPRKIYVRLQLFDEEDQGQMNHDPRD